MGIIKKEKREIFGILKRIKKRDFKDNEGIAIKNSFYNSSKTLISKIGGFIFTIILARFLMPELFGLFTLVMSTIFIFVSFTDFGIGSALTRYVSKNISKGKKSKVKGYFSFLFKLKIILIISLFLILILSSKFIANFYGKPIFLGLIIGPIYLVCLSLTTFFEYLFYSIKKFKQPFLKEIVFQIFRLVLFFLVILFIRNSSFSSEFILFLIVASLSLSSFLTLIFIFRLSRKKISFLKAKEKKLNRKEKKDLRKFIIPLSTIVLSGVFFGSIDTLMLGKFVSSEFLGFYNAAFKLVVSISPLIAFSDVLLPIFSGLKSKRLEQGFKKSIRLTFLLSLGIFLLVFIFAPLIIKIVFGNNYLESINALRILSLLLLCTPISKIYNSYITSIGKTKILAIFLIFSTILNIILNYILITNLLVYGPGKAILGAAIATIFSRYVLLFCLFLAKKRIKN